MSRDTAAATGGPVASDTTATEKEAKVPEYPHQPAGWYPDPTGQPVWRWWTGGQWSEHWAPMAGARATAPSAAATLQAGEVRLDGFMVYGVWIWVGVSLLGVLLAWSNVGWYHALWHWWHLALDASKAGQPAPPTPPPPASQALSTLANFCVLGIDVAFLIWQHHAASTARALGYPARRSPGWGVGCWFVPVVNLWMPYQALRDCLPPGHRARRGVLATWLLFLAASFLVPITIAFLVGAHGVGVVLVLVTVAVQLAMGWNASRSVAAIAADHRDAVAAPAHA